MTSWPLCEPPTPPPDSPRCLSLAVDVSSGVEMSKGIKDAAKIRDFVAAVRAAELASS